jgi:pentatricopeptide repeat protein
MRELLGYGVLTQEQVFQLFELATALQVDASTYNIPLRQASAAHNLNYARDIVDYMENTPGVTPNSETYHLLITAHTRSPNYKDAGAVLEKLRSFDAAEVEHYTALIELYGGEGEVALCVEIYSEFLQARLKPNVGIMAAMVEAFVKVLSPFFRSPIYMLRECREETVLKNLEIRCPL